MPKRAIASGVPIGSFGGVLYRRGARGCGLGLSSFARRFRRGGQGLEVADVVGFDLHGQSGQCESFARAPLAQVKRRDVRRHGSDLDGGNVRRR
jgi:hypothetical protein